MFFCFSLFIYLFNFKLIGLFYLLWMSFDFISNNNNQFQFKHIFILQYKPNSNWAKNSTKNTPKIGYCNLWFLMRQEILHKASNESILYKAIFRVFFRVTRVTIYSLLCIRTLNILYLENVSHYEPSQIKSHLRVFFSVISARFCLFPICFLFVFQHYYNITFLL